MKDAWGQSRVGRALLFERLVADPDRWFGKPSRLDPEPRRALDREGLRDSVRREVEALLNTRCPLPPAEALSRPRTTLDYGMPELEPMRPAEADGRRYVELVVRQTIEVYEPRLRDVDVTVVDAGPGPFGLLVSISGHLVVEQVREPLSFDVTLPSTAASGSGDGG